ncbi:class A beta-lactamase-related serine hydrolase [Rhodohalobacter sp. SW132]|uniref:serine hydrolase n=1 Tax=Rhodohalobacter sp. SW132 TaxID=2293433 RepID=UPI000E26F315|nr:serine hydrolase [Rhodohalobacter sp. SW132]REL33803.1 class A beta-lactamase-related serine hydrolase [Rhodohalobacter sp. SW132]
MKIRIIIVILAMITFKSCVPMEELGSSSETNPTISEVDKVVQDEIIKQNIPGAAVAVVKDGEIVHANGYGHTSLSRNEPITANTVFRWASISKPLTAVAILHLDEQDDDFSIEDKVSDHVSYWPDTGQKGNITIKQLLSHRSGIIHYTNTDNCPGNSSPSPDFTAHGDDAFNAENAVDIFKDQDLCFSPGSAYKYSTYGFSLAVAAFEEASGESYADWVMDNIAQPLEINSLQQGMGESEGYNMSGGRLVDRSDGSKTSVLPGGGWESNIRDLALFGNALLQGTLLLNTQRMWNESTGNSIYRLGIYRYSGGNRAEHGGDHNNLRTKMDLYPGRSDSLGVFVYINGRHADRNRLARRVATAMGVTTWNVSDEAIVTECTDQSGSNRYSAVWRSTGDDVIIRKGLSNDDFGSEWSYLREHQYYTDDFEAYTENGELRWDGIFRKGTGGNAMWRNFTRDEFNQKWKEQSDLGYRLVDVETYMVNGERRWAGLFRPGSGPYALFRYYSTSDFGDKREEMAESGLKLIDIEAFTHEGNLRWAGVWVEGEDGLLNRNYTQDEFGDLRNQRRAAGWKLIDIERYNTNNGVRWAGIWESSDSDERLNRNYRYCGDKDDDGNWDPLGITNRHNQWRSAGFELIDWERN